MEKGVNDLRLRAERWEASDGSTWCTIWYELENDPDAGHCFDFRLRDIDEIVRLLRELRPLGRLAYFDEGE